MIENEIIYDRIKGCLTAVALSDALNNLKLTTGKSFKSAFKFNPDYREKPVPEQYLQYYKGKNTTDKYLFLGFNGSPTMPPSNMMKALIDSMHALMMWKEDTQKSGIYVDPTAYLNMAIDMSPWIKSYWEPFESRICWSTAVAVGVLATWLFDYSKDINRDIKIVASSPLLALHLDDDEKDNARLIMKERTICGILAAVIRNLIIYNRHVDTADYLQIVSECALRNLWGDELTCNVIGKEALCDASNLSVPMYDFLFHMLDWSRNSIEKGSTCHGWMLYGGIRCSSIVGCVNGYESFPYKDMLKYVEVMPQIDELMTHVKTRFLNKTYFQ